jgi:hypothetical protein
MSTYYVDQTLGKDTYNGTTTTINDGAGEGPFKTIAKINSGTPALAAGDSVLFKRGETWREQLTVPSSGTDGSPITFGKYGTTGANPIISGADLVGTWTAYTSPQESGGIFASGMEAASLSDWDAPITTYTTVARDVAAKLNGVYGVSFTATGANNAPFLYKVFSARTSGTVYARTYFYIVSGALSNSKTGIPMLMLGNTAIDKDIWAGITTDGAGAMTLDCRLAPYVGISTGTAISANTWYCLEVAYKIHATEGGGQVWLDGVSKGSNYLQNTSATEITTVGIGPYKYQGMNNGGVVYYDDCKADTSPIGVFSASSDTIWQAAVTTEPEVVAFDGTVGTIVTDFGTLVADKQWYWTGNVLYQYSTSDPDTRYTAPGTEASIRNNGILAANIAYVTVQDIDAKYTQLANVYVLGNVGTHDGWTFSRLNLTGGGGGGGGLYVKAADAVTITDVISNYSDGPGLYLYNVTNSTITDSQGNYANDNSYAGTGIGIFITDGGTACHNLVFTRCTVTGNHDQGFGIAGGANEIRFYNCQATSSGDDGFSTWGTSNDVDFYYCWSTLNGILMTQANPEKGDGYTCHVTNYDVNFYYCVAYLNYDSGWAVGLDSYGKIYNCVAAYNGNVINDVTQPGRANYVINNDATGPLGEMWEMHNCISIGPNPKHLQLSAFDKDLVDLDYNIYYKVGEAVGDSTFCSLTSGTSPDTSWNTYHASYEANSQYIDPVVVSSSDFNLQSASPCRNAGVDVGLTEDYAGNAVANPPDIGAYEYGPVVPTLAATTAMSKITHATASSGGNVTDSGDATITARGVCWNTSTNPTTANSKTTDAGTTGSYTSAITGLTPATTYHAKAYATNSIGTSYGAEVDFTTDTLADISDAVFTVTEATTPVVSSLSDSTVYAGETITITGTSFGVAEGYVRFIWNYATITSWSDTSIVCVVPPFPVAGNLYVGLPTEVWSEGTAYTILAPAGITSGGSVSLGMSIGI